jgi:surfactin family lipopeptide synthetase A
LEIFIKEFIENYNENSKNEVKKDILNLQFKDYSEWFNRVIEENRSKNELFWKDYLQNYKPIDSFDRNYNMQNGKQNGGKLFFELSEETTIKLKKLATEKQVTFYSLLVTSINVLIYKLSKYSDICIGTVNSGRNVAELNDQVGMFVKTLVLRTQIKSEQNFVNLLETVHHNILEVNDYLDTPFDKIAPNIFDVMLVYQNPEFTFEDSIELNGLRLTSYPIDSKFSRMPLVFNLFESGYQLKGIIDYNSDLFEEDTIQRILLKFNKILKEVAVDPIVKLEMIEDSLENEKKVILDFDFNF